MNKNQFENFYTGTIFNFMGVIALTLLPIVANNLFLFINPIIYKIFALIFFILTGIYYFLSPLFLKKQLFIIGINFIFFSVFQFIFALKNYTLFSKPKYIALIIGIGLLIYSYSLKDKKK